MLRAQPQLFLYNLEHLTLEEAPFVLGKTNSTLKAKVLRKALGTPNSFLHAKVLDSEPWAIR